MFTCTSSKGHGLWFVIGGFQSVLFVSCFMILCFVIILFRAIIDKLSLLPRFFWSFLFLSLGRIKQPLLASFDKKIHSLSRFPIVFLSSLESFSVKLGKHVTLWFALTSPSLKWLTEQKNHCLQYAQHDTTNFAVKGRKQYTNKWHNC